MPAFARSAPLRTFGSEPDKGAQALDLPPCEYCGGPWHTLARRWGSHLGSSRELRDNILAGREASDHPWYTGRWSIAAHHLICSEAMADDEQWAQLCHDFGYDINRRENGVMLPMVMTVACELHVPVHKGPHAGGCAFDMDLAYPDAVKRQLRRFAESAESGAFCAQPAALTGKLDRLSLQILEKLTSGRWTLTTDGLDYLFEGNGCAGVSSIQDKPNRACPLKRQHGHRHPETGKPLQRRQPQVGE
ncbi:AHH domain-containing protein [Myxococcus sp. 1LA]